MSSSQQKTLDDFLELRSRNAVTHVIRAIVEIGVVESLRNGQKTSAQLADELKLNPLVLNQMLAVAEKTELIERYGEDYALSRIAKLIPREFLDFGDNYWQHLTFYARTGAPLPICEEVPISDRDFTIEKASEEWTTTPVALTAAQVLGLGTQRTGMRILEIASGSGIFGVTLAHSDPESSLVLADEKVELTRAEKTVQSVEISNRAKLVPVNNPIYIEPTQELQPGSFDLVILAGQIQRMTGGECQRIFQVIEKLLDHQGEIALIDVF
ncbi:MAG: hypothetical protein AAF623_15085, partial [Planctomycetota bacterium]